MFSNKRADGSVGVASENSYEQPASSAVRTSFSYDKNRSSNHSIVDECLTMKGDLESDGDILVKGKVLGNIKCKMLIVDVDALVEGGVEAEEVIIRGNSKGTIKANRVRLEKTATADSDICHQTFSAEEALASKVLCGSKTIPSMQSQRTSSRSSKPVQQKLETVHLSLRFRTSSS